MSTLGRGNGERNLLPSSKVTRGGFIDSCSMNCFTVGVGESSKGKALYRPTAFIWYSHNEVVENKIRDNTAYRLRTTKITLHYYGIQQFIRASYIGIAVVVAHIGYEKPHKQLSLDHLFLLYAYYFHDNPFLHICSLIAQFKN